MNDELVERQVAVEGLRPPSRDSARPRSARNWRCGSWDRRRSSRHSGPRRASAAPSARRRLGEARSRSTTRLKRRGRLIVNERRDRLGRRRAGRSGRTRPAGSSVWRSAGRRGCEPMRSRLGQEERVDLIGRVVRTPHGRRRLAPNGLERPPASLGGGSTRVASPVVPAGDDGQTAPDATQRSSAFDLAGGQLLTWAASSARRGSAPLGSAGSRPRHPGQPQVRCPPFEKRRRGPSIGGRPSFYVPHGTTGTLWQAMGGSISRRTRPPSHRRPSIAAPGARRRSRRQRRASARRRAEKRPGDRLGNSVHHNDLFRVDSTTNAGPRGSRHRRALGKRPRGGRFPVKPLFEIADFTIPVEPFARKRVHDLRFGDGCRRPSPKSN